MSAYLVHRLLLMIPTLFGVMTIFFIISEFVPGGPLDQVEAMIRDQALAGEGGGGMAGGAGPTGSEIEIDPATRLSIKRTIGLNHDRGERFLRTFLWFSPDSMISSVELEPNHGVPVVFNGRSLFIVRDSSEKFFAYENRVETPDGPSGLYLDSATGRIAAVRDPLQQFSIQTGESETGGEVRLEPVPITVKEETFSEFDYTPTGERIPVRETRLEVYLEQDMWTALKDGDNWHGYLLLRFPPSIGKNKNSIELIRERLPVSMRLGVISFFLTYSLCLVLGIKKAVKNNTRFDAVTSALLLIGYGIPGFVLAVFLIQLFGPGGDALVNLFPLGGLHSPAAVYNEMNLWEKFWDNVHHLIAPIICLTLSGFAGLTLLTKNSILDEFGHLYATAARARGLSANQVLYKHILRNALIPLVTSFPARFVMMFFAGSILIEKIFNLDGLGLLSFTALVERDFPLIMSTLFVFTLLGLFASLLRDICYVLVDPRISFEGGSQ